MKKTTKRKPTRPKTKTIPKKFPWSKKVQELEKQPEEFKNNPVKKIIQEIESRHNTTEAKAAAVNRLMDHMSEGGSTWKKAGDIEWGEHIYVFDPAKADAISKEISFDLVIENRLKKTKELLLVKGKEYVRGDNRFHNFDREAERSRRHPVKALDGMLGKHLVSVSDMLDDIEKEVLPSKATVDEKFGDIQVYFTLLEAMIKMRYLKQE